MSKWDYGGAIYRHPIKMDEIVEFSDGSRVKAHNIFDPLPDFMRHADLLFVDPPWNLGNLNTFYTKADRSDHQQSFESFYKRLFECIAEIGPKTCYIEVGKEYLPEFVLEMRKLFPQVTFYNSTYYRKKSNLCYVIRGGQKRVKFPLEGMDEEDIIKWICEHEEYTCIGDLCMGTGLVGKYATMFNRRFVGTELNPKRLALLVEHLANKGIEYRKIEM